VVLDDGTQVIAGVSIYIGKNLIGGSPDEIADMVLRARGEAGSCVEYLKEIVQALSGLNVQDQTVSALWQAVKERRSKS
jgi:cation transport regulator ChaC